jgi:hypothetical protein
VLIDSTYYKMIASDYRGNYSEYSEVVGIARPDVNPPSSPVMLSGIGTTDGIYINWLPSSSSDITHHTLERSSQTEGSWTKILTFTPKESQYYTTTTTTNFDYIYMDANVINQEYNYRLVAYDDNSNYTSSDIISVTPMVVTVEGRITDLDEFHTCDPTLSSESQAKVTQVTNTANTLTNSSVLQVKNSLLQLLQNGFITVGQYQSMSGQSPQVVVDALNAIANGIIANEKKKCYINVKWSYLFFDNDPDLKFEIYRAVNNYTFDLYKTLDQSMIEKTDFKNKWTDTAVVHGRKYSYKIVALNPNGTQSKVSNLISVILN